MNRRGHAVAPLAWGVVAVLVVMLACEDLNLQPLPGKRYSGEKPWVTAAIDILLQTYPLTEKTGNEYCGMLCQDADEQVFATDAIMGTKANCRPWDSPCPQDTKAIGTYHTQPVGPMETANPMRPFSPGDRDGTEPYDFIAQALTPRSDAGLNVGVYQFERGIQTVSQVYPVVVWPFPPRQK